MQFINEQNYKSDFDLLNQKFVSLFQSLDAFNELYSDRPEYVAMRNSHLVELMKDNKLNCYSYSNEQTYCGDTEGYKSFFLTWLTKEEISKKLKEYGFSMCDYTLHHFLHSLTDYGVYIESGYPEDEYYEKQHKISWQDAYTDEEYKLKCKEFNEREATEKQRKKDEETAKQLKLTEDRERELLQKLKEKYDNV